MISFMEKAQIISLFNSGISRRSIASIVGINRATVNSYVKEYLLCQEKINKSEDKVEIALLQEEMFKTPKKKSTKRSCSKFKGKLKARFEELIRNDNERNELIGKNKQQLNAAILWKQLTLEGFQIGESTVREHFADYKQKHPEVFIRQSYEYGQRAEFDFHQIKVIVGNVVRIYHQATISMPKSNRVFAYLFKNETTESVLKAIINFINDAGGVPKSMVFDNLTPVVSRLIYGGNKIYTKSIISISNYYGFEIITCNPSRGNEKGHVENSGKSSRSYNFCFDYSFANEEDLYIKFNQKLKEFNEKSDESWQIEKTFLMPKPIKDYIIAYFGKAIANSYSCVSIKGNFYSVPEENVGKQLDYLIVDDEIVIKKDDQIIAKHKKIDGNGQYVLEISHYLRTFMKKPGALHNSTALKQASNELKSIYENNYINNPRGFITFLLGDIPDEEKTIEEISSSQLTSVSKTFGQA